MSKDLSSLFFILLHFLPYIPSIFILTIMYKMHFLHWFSYKICGVLFVCLFFPGACFNSVLKGRKLD